MSVFASVWARRGSYSKGKASKINGAASFFVCKGPRCFLQMTIDRLGWEQRRAVVIFDPSDVVGLCRAAVSGGLVSREQLFSETEMLETVTALSKARDEAAAAASAG